MTKQYPVELFHYSQAEKCFSTEISKLNHHVGGDPAFDIVDVLTNQHGFEIKNESTGGIVPFYIAHVEWSNKGEIMTWVLVPTGAAVHQHPAIKNLQAIVYND